jgi:hypothetical protein
MWIKWIEICALSLPHVSSRILDAIPHNLSALPHYGGASPHNSIRFTSKTYTHRLNSTRFASNSRRIASIDKLPLTRHHIRSLVGVRHLIYIQKVYTFEVIRFRSTMILFFLYRARLAKTARGVAPLNLRPPKNRANKTNPCMCAQPDLADCARLL